ncbi:MAG TPA: hypothetical protein DDW91_09165, partial [Shewanella frigidimarina]|nr:hypothetical protein [Shewanella frigidimarina]
MDTLDGINQRYGRDT